MQARLTSSQCSPRPCPCPPLLLTRRRVVRKSAIKAGFVVADIAAALAADGADSIFVPLPVLLATVAVPLAGLAAWRFYTYSQLEYITAAMLTRHVPRDGNGANIIQIGGGTKELYYYPKNALQVTIVGEGINKGLLEQAGLQASVPTVAQVQSPSSLSFAASGTVDAVVALQSIGSMSPMTAQFFMAEVLRVLKPGRPLIFVEKDKKALFSYLESKKQQWEEVEYDMALEGQDPHVVGVALKSKASDGKGGPRRVAVEEPASKVLSKRDAGSASKDPSNTTKGFR